MLARTGSTAGKSRLFAVLCSFFFCCFLVTVCAGGGNKQKWRGLAAFDSFVALGRPSTSEERPLGEEEEGGVKI